MMRILYNMVLCVAAILLLPVGFVLALFVEKRKATFLPRLGFQDFPSLEKPVWVHGLSVGEINAAIPLVLALAEEYPHKQIMVSASTKTGFDMAKAHLSDTVGAVIYFPYDLPWSVTRAISMVDPSLCILVESDIWPNFVFHVKKKGIPLVLANGRLSDSSRAGYGRMSLIMAPVFQAFDRIGVQSSREHDRFLAIGASPESLHITGNFKFDRPQTPDLAPLDSLPEFPGPVMVAGSTHPGEESILANLLGPWKDKHGLSLIVAPRDPQRAGAVAQEFMRAGFSTAMYSQPSGSVDVVVVDVMGALGALYSRADISFVGGSLKPFGGHNPLEPAVFGKPIFFGPDMKDFPLISAMLLEKGGARQMETSGDLGDAVTQLLENPDQGANMGKMAHAVVLENQGAVEKTLALLDPYL